MNTLADSNTYNIVFRGIDGVGNEGMDTIKFVTYDTRNPKAQIEYETEFITSLEPIAGTVIKVTFNELQNTLNGFPKLKLFFDGDSARMILMRLGAIVLIFLPIRILSLFKKIYS